MNEIVEVSAVEKIKGMIFIVRGKHVMLDSDLARIYHCTNGTKDINKAVKRNIERFPNNFYFQLNEEEFIDWKSLFVTSKSDKIGLRKRPYVFTEQGVAMPSAVINKNIARVKIIRNYVSMMY